MEEQFVEFLNRYGAYDKFMENLKKPIEHLNADDYLLDGFTWNETSEGHDYWSELNQMWLNREWSTEPDTSGIAYRFPQLSNTAFLSHYLHRGDKIYLSEVLSDSTLPKTAVVDELIHGKSYVEVYLR